MSYTCVCICVFMYDGTGIIVLFSCHIANHLVNILTGAFLTDDWIMWTQCNVVVYHQIPY